MLVLYACIVMTSWPVVKLGVSQSSFKTKWILINLSQAVTLDPSVFVVRFRDTTGIY
jgi:hypothetical protein